MLQLFLLYDMFLMMQKAYKILEQHPQVHGSSIGMLGLSLGTSITLKMAVYSEVMKVRQLLLKVTFIILALLYITQILYKG